MFIIKCTIYFRCTETLINRTSFYKSDIKLPENRKFHVAKHLYVYTSVHTHICTRAHTHRHIICQVVSGGRQRQILHRHIIYVYTYIRTHRKDPHTFTRSKKKGKNLKKKKINKTIKNSHGQLTPVNCHKNTKLGIKQDQNQLSKQSFIIKKLNTEPKFPDEDWNLQNTCSSSSLNNK